MGVTPPQDRASGEDVLPEVRYLVLSSRLIPDLDGGYTIATLARARQMAARGADVQVLTVDPGSAADHAAHRAEFARRGMLPADVPLRNLFDEAIAPGGGAAAWLRDAAAQTPDDIAEASENRVLTDADGTPFLALPVISGDPDWHLSTAAVTVFDAEGAAIGALPGFGGLYRAWLAHLAADGEVVVICESRQLGELLAGGLPAAVRLVHTVHTMHLEPPYTPDAAMNPLWTRWFQAVPHFDAVLWPTAAQRDDVVARFGDAGKHHVAPHGIPLPAVDDTHREAGLIVSVARLAPGKRLDHAIHAFLAAGVPGSRFEIWGDGPDRARLEALIAEHGVGDRVQVMGHTTDPAAVLRRATVMLTATAYEGQGLSIVEAMAAGSPVISYDVRYGPADALAEGGGILVADGDQNALAAALRTLLTEETLRRTLAAEAPQGAARWSEGAAMAALARGIRAALDAPNAPAGEH